MNLQTKLFFLVPHEVTALSYQVTDTRTLLRKRERKVNFSTVVWTKENYEMWV